MKTPQQYKNLFIAALVSEYPDILDFELDVKEYDEETDAIYRQSTDTGECKWFIQRDCDMILSICSNHPKAEEVTCFAMYPITSEPLTVQAYCDMEYIKVKFMQEPPQTLLELMGITKKQFSESFQEGTNGVYEQVLKIKKCE